MAERTPAQMIRDGILERIRESDKRDFPRMRDFPIQDRHWLLGQLCEVQTHNAELLAALEGCLDSLEYVQQNGSNTGMVVREQRIDEARAAIARGKGG